jgi:hypothetical protein
MPMYNPGHQRWHVGSLSCTLATPSIPITIDRVLIHNTLEYTIFFDTVSLDSRRTSTLTVDNDQEACFLPLSLKTLEH